MPITFDDIDKALGIEPKKKLSFDDLDKALEGLAFRRVKDDTAPLTKPQAPPPIPSMKNIYSGLEAGGTPSKDVQTDRETEAYRREMKAFNDAQPKRKAALKPEIEAIQDQRKEEMAAADAQYDAATSHLKDRDPTTVGRAPVRDTETGEVRPYQPPQELIDAGAARDEARGIANLKSLVAEQQARIAHGVEGDIATEFRQRVRTDKWMESIPFSPEFLAKTLELNALKKKTADGQELSAHESLKLANAEGDEELKRQLGASLPSMITWGVADMIPYMAEFAATGPMAKAAGAPIRGLTATAANAMRQSPKMAKTVITAGKIAAASAGAIARTAVDPDVVGNALDRMTPEIAAFQDENGDFDFTSYGAGEGIGEAALKAFGQGFAENLGEVSGDATVKSLMKAVPKPIREKLGKAMIINAWLARNPGSKINDFNRVMQRGGRAVGGMVPEMLEGRNTAIIEMAIGADDDDGRTLRQKILWPSMKDFLAEAGVIAVPSLFGLTAGSIADSVDKRQLKNAQLKVLGSTEGVASWITSDPEAAYAIASKEQPTRKDFEEAGLPAMSSSKRAKVAKIAASIISEAESEVIDAPVEEEGNQTNEPITPPVESPIIQQPPAVEEASLPVPVVPEAEENIQPPAVSQPKAEVPVETDAANIQKIKNSIAEGEEILRTGEFNGNKYSSDKLEAVRKSVNNSREKIGLPPLPAEKNYEAMSWNDLRAEAKAAGVKIQTKTQVIRDLKKADAKETADERPQEKPRDGKASSGKQSPSAKVPSRSGRTKEETEASRKKIDAEIRKSVVMKGFIPGVVDPNTKAKVRKRGAPSKNELIKELEDAGHTLNPISGGAGIIARLQKDKLIDLVARLRNGELEGLAPAVKTEAQQRRAANSVKKIGAAESNLSDFRDRFPKLRSIEEDNPLYTELTSKENNGVPEHIWSDDPSTPTWDVALDAAKELGLLEENDGPSELGKLYRGRLPTKGELESDNNSEMDSYIAGQAYSAMVADIKDGIRPSRDVIKQFPDVYQDALDSVGVKDSSLADFVDEVTLKDEQIADFYDNLTDAELQEIVDLIDQYEDSKYNTKPAAAEENPLLAGTESVREKVRGETNKPQVAQEDILGGLKRSIDEGKRERAQGKMDLNSSMDFPAARTTQPLKPKTAEAPKPNIPARKLIQSRDIVEYVKSAWGIKVRSNATFKKRALGFYRPGIQEIRMKNERNIPTVLHELGHYWDHKLDWFSKKRGKPKGVAKELNDMGVELYGNTKPAGGYKAEGFAEFTRYFFLSDGEELKKKAPNTYNWFVNQYLPENPKEARRVRELERMVINWLAQSEDNFVDAFMSPIKQDWTPNRAAIRNIQRKFERQWIDSSLPVLRAMQDAGIDVDALAPEDNPYLMMTAYSMSATAKAFQSALHQTTDMAGNRTGESLADALAPVTIQGVKRLDEWKRFAVAVRASLLNSRGIESGIPQAIAESTIEKYRSDEFEAVLVAVTDWSRRQMQLLVDTGAMSKAEFEAIVRKNPIYVPFQRQFSKEELDSKKRGTGGKPIKQIKGSGREIDDILDAFVMQSEKITKAAQQADILSALVRLYDNNAGNGPLANLMSEIPAPQQATSFTAEKIRKDVTGIIGRKLEEAGQEMDEATEDALKESWDEDMLTVFTPKGVYEGRLNIVSIVDSSGKRRFFEVEKDFKEALEGVTNRESLAGELGKFSRKVVALQRLGATGLNPAFGLIRNFTRDALTAGVTYEYAKGGPLASIRGVIMDLQDSELKRQYDSMGIAMAGFIGQDTKSVKKVSRRLVTTNAGKRMVISTVMSPVQAFQELFGITESGPRIMEFQAALQYAKEKGMSEKSSALLATVAAKDVTVNFSRSGSIGKKANEMLLFFNAGVQSVDKFKRAFTSNPKRLGKTLLRGAGWLTTVTMMNYYRNKDDDWWKKLPPHEKYGFTHFKVKDDLVIRIPMPFEFGMIFGSLPMAATEYLLGNKDALKEWSEFAVKNFGPSISIAAVTPIMEVYKNEKWYGAPIVPEHMKTDRLPEDQFTTRTSELAKMAGRAFNQSPAVLEHLVNGYSGGLYGRIGKIIAGSSDTSEWTGHASNLPIVGTLFLRPNTTRVVGDFYQKMADITKMAGSQKASIEELGELAAAETVKKEISPYWKAIREASDKKASERRKVEDSSYKSIEKLIREHNSTQGFKRKGIYKLAVAATDPSATPAEKEYAAKLLADENLSDVMSAFTREWTARGYTKSTRHANGKRTAFGQRRIELIKILKKDSK